MRTHTYTPFDLTFPLIGGNLDLIVKGLEYVRINLGRIEPSIPEEVAAALWVGGTAHNAEPIPFLMLIESSAVKDAGAWDALAALDSVQAWIDAQDSSVLLEDIRRTAAPTFQELSAMHGQP